MALNRGLKTGTELHNAGKTRFSGNFLRKNGMRYNGVTGHKIDPNKSYVRDTKSTLNELHANQRPVKINYRGSFLKQNGVNYNPYSNHKEAINPDKTYSMNRHDMDAEIKENHQPTKINYRGSFLKRNGINYNPYSKHREAINPNKVYRLNRHDMESELRNGTHPTKIKYRGSLLRKHGLKYDETTGKPFKAGKTYRLNRNRADSIMRQNDYEKAHPYSTAHPNIGLKGDLKRAFRLHRDGISKHQNYTGSYLKKNGVNYNPYSTVRQKIDPNKSYSMPKKRMDSEIKDEHRRRAHPYSYYHPNRGFVGDMIHKGTLNARGIKNALNYKMKHAFSGGVAHKISDQRPENTYSGLKRHVGGMKPKSFGKIAGHKKLFGRSNSMQHGLAGAKGQKAKSVGKIKRAKVSKSFHI